MRKPKKKRTAMIMTIVISAVMVLSVFGVVLYNDTGTNALTYGKYTFNQVTAGYQVKINGKYYIFDYFPSDVAQINISQAIIQTLKNAQAVILTFNPNETADNLQYVDLARFELADQSPLPFVAGTTSLSQNYTGMPVITCNNATASTPVIMLNISADTNFVQENNCIIMNAKLKQIIAAKDRLMYTMLGVMN